METLPPELRDKAPDTISWPTLECPKCSAQEFGVHGTLTDGQLMYVCQSCTYSQVIAGETVSVNSTDQEDQAFAKLFMNFLDKHNATLSGIHLEDPIIQSIVKAIFSRSIGEYDRRQKEGVSLDAFEQKLNNRIAFIEGAVAAFNEAISKNTKFTKAFLRTYQQKNRS